MRLPVNKFLCRLLGLFGFPTVWEVSVGSVLFRLDAAGNREYLILQYPSGHFDFPKGHIEADETEEDTLRRETEEETGIKELEVYPERVSIKYFYEARGNEYERRKREGRGTWIFKIVHFYPALAKGNTEVKISHEHIGSLWLPFDRALEKVTFVNAKRVLQETEDYLRRSKKV
ncbi:MAG: bis(5'-nucleosyl)-tetraphosphatase [Undibacterium sp.]